MTDAEKIFDIGIKLQPGEEVDIDCGRRAGSIKTEIYRQLKKYKNRVPVSLQRLFSVHSIKEKPDILTLRTAEQLRIKSRIKGITHKSMTLDELYAYMEKEAGSIDRQGVGE